MQPAPKIAVVTGASSGIGKAAAEGLHGAGWTTVLLSRSGDLLAEQAATLSARRPGSALPIVCDVADAAAVAAAFADVERRYGRVDLLFNNAGIGGPAGCIDEVPLDGWQRTVDTNLHGAFHCAREAFSLMKRQQPQGGRIINNGSIAAHTPRPRSVCYAVTKHAIAGLTKCLSLDGRAYNIACGQIDIGNVRTDMTLPMTQGMLQANGERRREPVFELPEVVSALLYMAGLPLEANVQSMTVMATAMPFIGRG